MYRKIFPIIISFILFFLINFQIYSDERIENIELYLVIDKSKSMVEEIEDVSDYINQSFIKDFLIRGDKLVMIQFFGKAQVLFEGYVSDENKIDISEKISGLEADGRFTDIGNALDKLKQITSTKQQFSRRYLILLTDGKQEAPPESPYYTEDGSFNHEFLEHTKVIQRNGWKIMILGVGFDTAVEELAQELGTTSETLDFSDEKPVPKTSDEVLGRITASDFSVNSRNISFKLISDGYNTDRNILIEQLTYQTENGNFDLLENTVQIKIEPESSLVTKIDFSETMLAGFNNNDNNGTLLFKFGGDTPFLPAVVDNVFIGGLKSKSAEEGIASENTDINEKSGKSKINWFILILVVLVIAGIVAFIIVRNIILHRDDDEREKQNNNEISGNS